MAAIEPLGGVTSLLRGAAASPAAGAVTGAGAAPGTNGIAGAGGAGGVAATPGAQPPAGSFVDSLGDALGQLNTQLNTADAAMAGFAAGGSADLHTVMLELQQASIALKTGIAVRDKLLEAYQELMRLQI
jgi:flagellar hook-basal body complex protein FliE